MEGSDSYSSIGQWKTCAPVCSYGYQGASENPHQLALTHKLLEAVICEARICGTGHPVILSGDFNVDPMLIPVVAEAVGGGRFV